MKSSKIQVLVIVLALVAYGFAAKAMLNLPTVILPSLYLVLLFTPFLFGISMLLGALLKWVLNPQWHLLTLSSIFILIISSIFYISQYRPTYEILLPADFTGDVNLIVSNEQDNDFKISTDGIGYINYDTYKNGFIPKVIKGDKDITSQVKGFSRSSWAYTSQNQSLSMDYLNFEVQGRNGELSAADFEELIKQNAIDTTRLKKKK